MGAMNVEGRQSIVALDLEGVIVPEIWIALAERTGIEALRRTTRDEPDYDTLMKYRLKILNEHGITMSVISDVISGVSPLEGAKEFLDELRSFTQVVIISDTFEQFAGPLMAQLDRPMIFCHRLVVENDHIVNYRLRMADQKRHVVKGLHALEYHVVAAGDSYNDLSMLSEADTGILFRAPDRLRAQHPELPTVETHADLLWAIRAALGCTPVS
jgi:phosphoserine / homoserine phosphotransferase